MSKLLDTIVVFRILKRLTTPWEKTKAYKHGIIDKKGKILRKTKELTNAEKNDYTMLDRLVFNLKRTLQKVPGGAMLGSYIAALALIKEYVETETNKETANLLIEKLEEHNIIPAQEYDLSTVEGFMEAWEDEMVREMTSGAAFGGRMSGAGSNADINATGMAGIDQPLKKKKKRKLESVMNRRL